MLENYSDKPNLMRQLQSCLLKRRIHKHVKQLLYCGMLILPFSVFASSPSCKATMKALKSDIIAVVQIDASLKNLTVTNYVSKDCKTYKKLFSNPSPNWLKNKKTLCGILPAGEITPGLCGIKMQFCSSKKKCKVFNVKLISDQHGRYIAAKPNKIKIDWDKN